MSERDPIDKAYSEAEAVLNDEAARAARRARVLAAVAKDQAEPTAVPEAPKRRPVWVRGGWLAAACAAGLSLVVVLRANPPAVNAPPAPAARPEVPVAAARDGKPAAPTVAARPSAAEPGSVPARAPAAPPVAEALRRELPEDAVPLEFRLAPAAQPPAAAAPPPRAPPPAPPPPPPPPPPPSTALSAEGPQEVVVTGSRIQKPAGALARDQAPSRAARGAPAAPALQAARLRAAAAAGRLDDITALLEAGVPVDAADAEGETALMKAIKAKRPAAAALLHDRGANLELKNRKGVSAREMAAAIGDPELDRALGIVP